MLSLLISLKNSEICPKSITSFRRSKPVTTKSFRRYSIEYCSQPLIFCSHIKFFDNFRWDDGTSNGVRLIMIDKSNEDRYLDGESLGAPFHFTGFYRIYEIHGSFMVICHTNLLKVVTYGRAK